jgi:hypothetical protein
VLLAALYNDYADEDIPNVDQDIPDVDPSEVCMEEQPPDQPAVEEQPADEPVCMEEQPADEPLQHPADMLRQLVQHCDSEPPACCSAAARHK